MQVLSKVVGVSDLYAWGFGRKEFFDIHPKTVKRLVANDENADKEAVANALQQFVGKREYACDDESDAVAVGLAYLLMNKMIDDPYPRDKKPAKPRKTKARKVAKAK